MEIVIIYDKFYQLFHKCIKIVWKIILKALVFKRFFLSEAQVFQKYITFGTSVCFKNYKPTKIL